MKKLFIKRSAVGGVEAAAAFVVVDDVEFDAFVALEAIGRMIYYLSGR